jgi:hypothetical protein
MVVSPFIFSPFKSTSDLGNMSFWVLTKLLTSSATSSSKSKNDSFLPLLPLANI